MGSSNGDRRRRRRWRRMTWYDIPSVTDPQDHLLGKRILVVADELSLSGDADRCRLAIRFEALAHRLRSRTSSADLHLILSGERDEAYTSRAWAEEIGWQAHVKPWDMTPIPHGLAHSVHDSAFVVGLLGSLVSEQDHDIVLLGSSSATVALTVACLRERLRLSLGFMTLAMSGSSADRLTPRCCPLVSANVTLGFDCLSRNIPHSKQWMVPLRD